MVSKLEMLQSHLKQEKEDNAEMQEMLYNEIDNLNEKNRNLEVQHKRALSLVQNTLQELEALQAILATAETLDFGRQEVQQKLERIIGSLKKDSGDVGSVYQNNEYDDEYDDEYGDEYDEGDYEERDTYEENYESDDQDDSFDQNGLTAANLYKRGSNQFSTRARSRTEQWINQGREKMNAKGEMNTLLEDVYKMVCKTTSADPTLDSSMQYSEFISVLVMSNIIDDHLTIPKCKEIFEKVARSNAVNAKKLSRKIQFGDFKTILEELAQIKLSSSTPGVGGSPSPYMTLLSDYIWPARARLSIKSELTKNDVRELDGKFYPTQNDGEFEELWLKPSVINYLGQQHESLMKIFKRYKNLSATSVSPSSAGEPKTAVEKALMPVQNFCQFTIDYEMVPQMVPKQGLMRIVNLTTGGGKEKINFREFEQILGRFSREVYKDSTEFNTLASQMEQLFFEIDRGSQIFRHSAATIKKRTSEVERESVGFGGQTKGRRRSTFSEKRISNVTKIFMLDAMG